MKKLFPIFAIATLTACAGGPKVTDTPTASVVIDTSSAVVENLPNDIHWSRNSAERHVVYLQTFRAAEEALEDMAEDLEPNTWAVSLDADETIFDNSLYQKELIINGTSYDPETWNEWCERREATALPGSVEFVDKIRELGGKVVIVSNRYDTTQEATEENLDMIGVDYDMVLLRQGAPDKQKERRWNAVQEGTASADFGPLDIVMYLGDNIEDFPDLGQDIRFDDEDAFEEFGARFVVFPNPMYGSWMGNEKR